MIGTGGQEKELEDTRRSERVIGNPMSLCSSALSELYLEVLMLHIDCNSQFNPSRLKRLIHLHTRLGGVFDPSRRGRLPLSLDDPKPRSEVVPTDTLEPVK